MTDNDGGLQDTVAEDWKHQGGETKDFWPCHGYQVFALLVYESLGGEYMTFRNCKGIMIKLCKATKQMQREHA